MTLTPIDLARGVADLARNWPGDGPIVIGIAGGSGSGKTTIADAVYASLDATEIVMIQHDSYYRDLRRLSSQERATVNFDHPDSLETELLVEHLESLRSGEAVAVPVYDFATHTRTESVVLVDARPVVLVEGILVLADERLNELFDLRIFVDTDSDLRFIRRMQRDVAERGRTVDSVIEQYQSTVRPMHVEFVEPSKRRADLIIPEGYNDGAVGAVTGLLRSHLIPHRDSPTDAT